MHSDTYAEGKLSALVGMLESCNSRDAFREVLRMTDRIVGAFLGSGAYGTVHRIAGMDDRVVKICRGWENSSGRILSDGWVRFAAYALQNPHPNLARIDRLVVSKSYAVAILPRYQTYDEDDHMQSSFYQGVYDAAYGRTLDYDCHDKTEYDKGVAVGRILLSAADACSVDIHEYNVMYDPTTKEMVVTDPFSGSDAESRSATQAMLRSMDHPALSRTDAFSSLSIDEKDIDWVPPAPKEEVNQAMSAVGFLRPRDPVNNNRQKNEERGGALAGCFCGACEEQRRRFDAENERRMLNPGRGISADFNRMQLMRMGPRLRPIYMQDFAALEQVMQLAPQIVKNGAVVPSDPAPKVKGLLEALRMNHIQPVELDKWFPK